MGNNEHGDADELLMNDSADFSISSRVNAGCGFIEDEYLLLLQ
jgi:hypothetical protein